MIKIIRQLTIATIFFSGIGLPTFAQETGNPTNMDQPDEEYSPFLSYNYPDQVFWGETHVHRSYSTDSGMFSNRLGPDEAYRFAKGEEVTSSSGVRVRLLRPLDWLVVADHAEKLGQAPMTEESDPTLLATDWGREIHDLVKAGELIAAYNMWAGGESGQDPLAGKFTCA